MDDVIEFLMELIPDAITDLFSEKIFGWIKLRVENKFLRGVYYTLTTVVLAVIGVALTIGLLALIGLLIPSFQIF